MVRIAALRACSARLWGIASIAHSQLNCGQNIAASFAASFHTSVQARIHAAPACRMSVKLMTRFSQGFIPSE
jgi:hypothetical protein